MIATREEFYRAASDVVSDWDDIRALPFDVAAAITALGAVESGWDTKAIGDNGSSVGALQVHYPAYLWATASYLVLPLEDQMRATRPAFADTLAYCRRMRAAFRTKPDAYDPRDEVKWFNLVWQFGGPFALAWAKAATTSDPVSIYTTVELRKRYDDYLRNYNYVEDRESHPWVTAVRDELRAQRDALIEAINRGVLDGVTTGVEAAAATIATPLLILLMFVAFKKFTTTRRGYR